jgi:hypothetical protein
MSGLLWKRGNDCLVSFDLAKIQLNYIQFDQNYTVLWGELARLLRPTMLPNRLILQK